ncbi:MAG: 16S rRNA (adenine(1518)-N(6)/adenine(1519)-N(6))-dimethyltransferase RsmA [Bacteroidota bacterium]
MLPFKANKALGQHFLQDRATAQEIVAALTLDDAASRTVLEIGPGTGVLTDVLVKQNIPTLYLVEVDAALAAQLRQRYPALHDRIITADFLQLPLAKVASTPMHIIGNFPYNISSPILFKILAHRQQVREVVCMVQQEVAERLVAVPRSKAYGIPSVLLQAFYDIAYLFSVGPQVFVPPPKVHSAVIRLQRNQVTQLACDEALFFKVVKAGFQQRRKTLRNALKGLFPVVRQMACPWLGQRAEELSGEEFVALTKMLDAYLDH